METKDKERRTTEQLYALRKQAVRLHLKGLPVMQIVAMTGLSWPGVRAALDRYEAGGMAALKPGIRGKKPGMGRTARPRIQPKPELQEKSSLVDLEHARLTDMMLPKTEAPRQRGADTSAARKLNAACAWQTHQAALTWALPQQQPFRARRGQKEVPLVLLPADEDGGEMLLYRIYPDRRGSDVYSLCEEGYRHNVSFHPGQGMSTWGEDDLLSLLREQAEARDWSLCDCAKRFATVKVLSSERGWRYHPALGFAKERSLK